MSDGETLRDGRYQIVGTLGEGAQGTTFDAIDRKEGRPVAIKRFAVRGARSWKDVELAEREASVLEAMSHPLLPAHVDHFEENGALYLVMEKIQGENLAALVQRGGSLSREDVVAFLRDAADVLDYLHGRSPPVIHRDVTPRNVIRRTDGTFVLVDFGAVRDRLKPEGGSTVVGTFGYMAPEQFQGRALPQSDVYAVGATTLRLLTGLEPDKLPHKGLSIDVAAALAGHPPPFREALSKMLDPNPDRRAASLKPIVDRLERDLGVRRPASSRQRDEQPFREGHSRRQQGDTRRDEQPRAGRGEFREPSERRRGRDDRGHWSYRDERRASREEARRQREEWRQWRDQLKEMRRAARRSRRRARPFGGPPLALVVLGVSLAMVVVGLVCGVIVPTFLTILSLFFGPGLRDAARATRRGGERARDSMAHFRQYLIHGPPARETTASRVDEEPEPRVRVDSPEGEPVRRRVDPDEDDVIDTTGSDVTEPRHRHR